MADLLTPPPGRKGSHRADVVRLTLGLPPDDGGLSPLGPWPVQARIAEHLDIKQPPVSRHHRAEIKRWAEAEWLRAVGTELVEIVGNFGRVMTASQAAQELRALHGAQDDTPERVLARSLAVVRAAVEAETREEEGHEPRLAVHRSGDTLLLASESLPGTDDPNPRELADYAADLGTSAEQLAGREPLLAGRSWQVTYIDWRRRRCFVEPVDGGGKAKWSGAGFGQTGSYELTRAERQVLLGEDPPVNLTQRASSALRQAREEYLERVHPGGTLVIRDAGGSLRWWTWAGHRTNATLAATLDAVAVPGQHINDRWIRLREDVTALIWGDVRKDATNSLCLPSVDERALRGLKFSDALPPRLAEATLSARLADTESAAAVLTESVRFLSYDH